MLHDSVLSTQLVLDILPTVMPPDRLTLKSYAYKPPASGRVSKSRATKVVAEDECSDPESSWARGVKAEDVHYPRNDDERAAFTLKNGKVCLCLLVD